MWTYWFDSKWQRYFRMFWIIFTIFFYFRCIHFEKGCEVVFPLSEQDDHLARCRHHSQTHVSINHDSTTCPQCGDMLDTTIAESHQTLVCPNAEVACSFLTVGCEWKILRKDYQVWEEDPARPGFTLPIITHSAPFLSGQVFSYPAGNLTKYE